MLCSHLLMQWWTVSLCTHCKKVRLLYVALSVSLFVHKNNSKKKLADLVIIFTQFQNVTKIKNIWTQIFLILSIHESFLRWDFKSLNPSKTQTRASIEPKSGLVLIRPIKDYLASFLSVVDRMPSDQLWQGDVSFENSNSGVTWGPKQNLGPISKFTNGQTKYVCRL